MKVGDLVIKRLGRIDPYQQNTIGVVVGMRGSGWIKNYVMVSYPGIVGTPRVYRRTEFEVISEAR